MKPNYMMIQICNILSYFSVELCFAFCYFELCAILSSHVTVIDEPVILKSLFLHLTYYQ